MSLTELIAKLEKLGICNPLLSWLESYLCDRSTRVMRGVSISKPFSCPSGVSQGIVLNPLLFSLFVNDICAVLPSDFYLMFADDLKLYLPISSPSNCFLLQDQLNSLSTWCRANGLTLCISNCNVMPFSRSPNHVVSVYCIDAVPLDQVSA